MNIYLSDFKERIFKLLINSSKANYYFLEKTKYRTLFIIFILLTNMSALPLQAQTEPTNIPETNPRETQSEKPMQSDRINYFGLGGAIGLEDTGETTLGEGGFSILGRFSLTNNFSIHSSSIISGDNLLSIAATGGIPIKNQETGRTIVFPFVGGGISTDTEDFNVDPVVVGGVDVPINRLFIGTVRVNANFGERPRVADRRKGTREQAMRRMLVFC